MNRKTSIAIGSVAILALSLAGEYAMPADIELKWEWPAGRAIEDRILVKVEGVKEQSPGFFGLGETPSLASNIPEPTVITGIVRDRDTLIDGKSIKIVVPKPETGNTGAGSYAVLGIVDKNICICIAPVDSADADITQINCP